MAMNMHVKWNLGAFTKIVHSLHALRYLNRVISTSQTLPAIVTTNKPKPIPPGELDDEFRTLIIPGHSDIPDAMESKRKKDHVHSPRYLKLQPDQDWTNEWPTAASFKWSVVPLPLRMGISQGDHENKGLPPGKYANAELMKIPNFLHLTPPHIKKHCNAIKKFCTPWPEGLETDEDCDKHFPMTIITRDYVRDDISVRDDRSRLITLQVKLSDLELDYHARDKLLRLVGDRYDKDTDMLVLTTNRCPLKKQNIDYAQYLLTALFFESWKTEPWESEKEREDMEKFFWDIMPSRKSVVDTIKMQKARTEEKALGSTSDHISHVDSKTISEEEIIELEQVRKYKDAVTALHNDGEDLHTLNEYKRAAMDLLLGQKGESAN